MYRSVSGGCRSKTMVDQESHKLSAQIPRRNYLQPLCVWICIWLLAGCSSTPAIYTMPAAEVETIRSDFTRIGVVLLGDPPQNSVLKPARGFWGGVFRGAVVGGSLPVMTGFFSPVPGGALIGAVVAPFTALIGAVYGGITAPAELEVETAETLLARVSADVEKADFREKFQQEVIRMGNANTGYEFIALAEAEPQPPADRVSRRRAQTAGCDTILELKIEEVGLRGIYGIDPATDVFVKSHIRLLRAADHSVLLNEKFTCMSDQERKFEEWAAHRGRFYADEFRSCAPELAEKIVDDFFRVYPVASN
jgi:hypothetical protein